MILRSKYFNEIDYQLDIVKTTINYWKDKLHCLETRIAKVEKNQLMMEGISLDAPFGSKFTFTFTNLDRSHNGGICSSAEILSRLVETVKEMGGTNLVIKDESIYLKATKSNY